MNITFATPKSRKLCNSEKRLMKRHGAKRARKIRLRLDDLQAAENLDEFRHLPGRCHELKGDRAGQLSLDLDGPYRLIFAPANDPYPQKPDGGLDWTKVTDVIILDIEDTHQ